MSVVAACGDDGGNVLADAPPGHGGDGGGDDGRPVDADPCSDGGPGCPICVPGATSCVDVSHVRTCDPSGFTYTDSACEVGCAEGACQTQCTGMLGSPSYVGCEYWPTVTSNVVDQNTFHFAITISNAGAIEAAVSIDGAGLTPPIVVSVPPGEVVVQTLPWVNPLSYSGGLVTNGAYRVRSTAPITVYQFNPLEYVVGTSYAYTNDASMLIPVDALRTHYFVASYTTVGVPGGFTITATEDATMVTIKTRGNSSGSGGAPVLVSGVPQTVMLNRGDVLGIDGVADAGVNDLTGSEVTSDKPVQVIGNHECTDIPLTESACDHIEESMLPVDTLSTSYAVTMPAVPTLLDGKEQVVRIVATEAGTTLDYDPPIAGASTTLANAGDFVELERHQGDFVVTGSKKILVAQYAEGQSAGGNTGDPDLSIAVPTDQYRTSYLFHAPLNYEVSYVNLTAPVGTVVMVDGMPVTIGHAIGASGTGVERYQLTDGLNGNHVAESATAFGISVYGYGQYTSYWYPGGLNLQTIVIQ